VESTVDAIEPFIGLVIYPTTADAQQRRAETVARVGQELRLLPGFLRAQVLVSEDGESLVTITWWADRESFEQFRQSETGRAAAVLATGAHPKAFWLRLHADVQAP
jgi:heme-degrading monooxygenase HmoA